MSKTQEVEESFARYKISTKWGMESMTRLKKSYGYSDMWAKTNG